MRERVLTLFVLILLATLVMLALGMRSDASTSTRSAITYCETNPAGRHFETYIELANGHEFVVTDIRPGWSPFLGERRLVESAVFPRQRRVMACEVVKVNGLRTAVLTTRGGAEWHVIRPWTEW
jgi:hypothetical protein